MSRLSSFIRRMEAQRACLNQAAARIASRSGLILEFGLGNGRTFDHLRELMPDRKIYIFDRALAAHSSSIPEREHLILGNVIDTLPKHAERFRSSAALVHYDIGVGDTKSDQDLARRCFQYIANFLKPGGLIISSVPMRFPAFKPSRLPGSVAEGRYFQYELDILPESSTARPASQSSGAEFERERNREPSRLADQPVLSMAGEGKSRAGQDWNKFTIEP